MIELTEPYYVTSRQARARAKTSSTVRPAPISPRLGAKVNTHINGDEVPPRVPLKVSHELILAGNLYGARKVLIEESPCLVWGIYRFESRERQEEGKRE